MVTCSNIAGLLFSIMAVVEVRDSTSCKSINYKEVRDIDFTSKKTVAKKLTSLAPSDEKTPIVRKTTFPKATRSDFIDF